MAASNTEICNLALGHLGTSHQISDLETEDSAVAKACRTYYDTALDIVLRDFDWGFASEVVELALVSELDPEDGAEYAYSYRYPTNAAKVRRILSGARVDTPESAVPYRLGQDAAGRLIIADAGPNYYFSVDHVYAEITAKDIAPEHYPSDFTLALSYYLASLIAPRIMSGDLQGNGTKALQKYYLLMSQAAKNDAKESSPDVQYDSEFIRIRS